MAAMPQCRKELAYGVCREQPLCPAMCEFNEARGLRLQQMTAKRAATAASR